MTEQIAIPHSTIAQMLRRSLREQQYVLASVTSGSMRPLFEIGDQIGLTSVPPAKLHVGDIITFETTQEIQTHRITTITPTHIITRGDRVIQFDAPIQHEQLIGRVVMRRRGDNILDLRQGEGKWLNRQLHQLAEQEAVHFTRRYWKSRPMRGFIHRIYTLRAQQIADRKI